MSLTEEDIDKIAERVLSKMNSGSDRADPPETFRNTWERARANRLAAKNAESDFVMEFFRDQAVGIFGYFVKWGRGIKEGIAVIASTQADFMFQARNMGRTKIPTNLVALVVFGVAIIAMFTVNPELLQGLGLFVTANQYLVVFVALIVLIAVYLWVRRRRK